MPTVARPIIVSDSTSIDLRPMRSPKCPITTPPIGRATKPTANVAKAASVEASEEEAGKNCGPITSAAAVP